MNRPYLGAGEINRIYAAELIRDSYLMKSKSDNWAQWAKDNPMAAEKLAIAERLALEEENGSG